jgi:hypothetical protein
MSPGGSILNSLFLPFLNRQEKIVCPKEVRNRDKITESFSLFLFGVYCQFHCGSSTAAVELRVKNLVIAARNGVVLLK